SHVTPANASPLAVCTNPTHGPADPFASAAALTARLARRWASCSANDGTDSIFHRDGIAFDANGTYVVLARDADGSYQPLTGVENQGTWDMRDVAGNAIAPTDTSPLAINYVYLRPTGGEVATLIAFETNPVRMKTSEASVGTTTWLVPIDP